MKRADLEVGDLVLYVPYHAHGNRGHPDCEVGVVKSMHPDNTEIVFVRFSWRGIGQGCSPDQLEPK